MSKTTFRDRLADARPDLAKSRKVFETKRKLAMALRTLRKGKGLTQKDIESRSDLTQPMISRLESPSGPMPNWDTMTRYVEACGGHMLLGFGGHAFDEEVFLQSQAAEDEVLSAVAL